MPAWTYWNPGSWYGGTNPSTGAPQDWYNTPLVRDDLSQELPYGEFERFLSNQGFDGFGRNAEWARSQYNRTRSGYDAAQLSNPNLSYRDFLATLPSMQDAYASLSAQARGDNTPGQTRRILWG
jgi:hypothetical protein